MTATTYLRQNHFLDLLPGVDFERLYPHLERINLTEGEVLNSAGGERYAYFPLTSILSLISMMEHGGSFEIAVIGNEGMVGSSFYKMETTMPNRVVVRKAGRALRLPIHFLDLEFNRTGGRRKGTLHHLLLRYHQVLMTQIAQSVVCNRHHSLDQQLSRWLLLSLDRQDSNEVSITHEILANMLSVRREGITASAVEFQRAGLIAYHRGHIKVLDRSGVETHACQCYQIVKREYDRLLSPSALTSLIAPTPQLVFSIA